MVVREILCRTANRTRLRTVFVANAAIPIPKSPYLELRRVAGGFDVADDTISGELQPGDLVVTADIPLAAQVIARGGHALSPRGEMFSADTIGGRLHMRDFMDTLRSSGIHTGGPRPFGPGERKAFADSLDRFLAKHRHAR